MNVMKLAEIIGGTLLSGSQSAEKQVTGGYCCDLLSHVMASAPQDCAWMTVLTHTNIVAVAELAGVSCIVVPEGISVPPQTAEKADAEQIPLISTELSSYEVSWRLHDALQEA